MIPGHYEALVSPSDYFEMSFRTGNPEFEESLQRWTKENNAPGYTEAAEAIRECYAQRAFYLNLSEKGLTSLPSAVKWLTHLGTLDLSSNEFTTLPEPVTELTGLYELSIARNRLTTLDKRISNLGRMIHLDISYNLIEKFPETFVRLTTLQTLNAGDNQLTKIGPFLTRLVRRRNQTGDTALAAVNLKNNRITGFPSMDDLRQLGDAQLPRGKTRINLTNNRISRLEVAAIKEKSPPPEIELDLTDNRTPTALGIRCQS